MGSEMCIRDRSMAVYSWFHETHKASQLPQVLYTALTVDQLGVLHSLPHHTSLCSRCDVLVTRLYPVSPGLTHLAQQANQPCGAYELGPASPSATAAAAAGALSSISSSRLPLPRNIS